MNKTEIDDNITLQDAPEKIFTHVEKSLDNGIKIGMLLEIQHKKDPETYWIASITMACGHLLRVRYIGSEEDIWCDITKTVVRPVGWCNHFDENLNPPEGISSGDDVIDLMTSMVERRESIPNESIINSGLTPIDRIVEDMKLEVQSETDPYCFWIATIVENVGGRLRLRYDTPKNLFPDFWIFYTDERLRNIGYTVSKGAPYKLVLPENPKNIKLNESEINFFYNAALESTKNNIFPENLISFNIKPPIHQFEVRMKLEAVNPQNMSEICPATVVKVFDAFYFLVMLDEDLKNNTIKSNRFWLCTVSHPYIFPIGWAETNKIEISPPTSWDRGKSFDWGEYLQVHSSISAPAKYFEKHTPASETGFEEFFKLEVVNPLDNCKICPAHITKVTKHILHIYIDSTKNTHFFNCASTNIFPPGWCSSLNIPLQTFQESSDDSSSGSKKSDIQRGDSSDWCEKIYFNYKCYSGPLISKNKLSQLPKSVGPGPLSLVIREVLDMVISVAYKPAKLLKDWEQEQELNPRQKTVTLRAKLKSSTYYADIQVASTQSEIATFCREICGKLQACPYLFGPSAVIGDECPENCLKVDKSRFQISNNSDRRGRNKGNLKSNTKKKMKCKKLSPSMTVQAIEKRAILETGSLTKDEGESGNDTDNSPSSTSYKSENGTRPNSPDSNSDMVIKKQRKKRELKTQFPRLEMKTRGAKLPNFALQIKEGHWDKKDVETIYSNTCAVPRKPYTSETEDESSSDSLEMQNNRDISDVSDSEEPELKKLRVTPLRDPLPTDTKNFNSFNNPNFRNYCNNPTKWSVNDMYNYLKKFDECKDIAEKLREEEVDGTAFIMLNFPTMREHLKMKMKPALNLCKHVAILKWSFLSKVSSVNSC